MTEKERCKYCGSQKGNNGGCKKSPNGRHEFVSSKRSMRVLLEFPGSHHYWEEYRQCDLFCPNCGVKKVWEEQGPGDFYVGVSYICEECGFMFTMPTGSIPDDEWSEIVKQIRSGIAHKPTTREGN